MAHIIYSQISNPQDFIEAIDYDDRPIMIINKEQAYLKNILHRQVVVILYNHKKQYLINYKAIKKTNDYLLDLSATSLVIAGQSRLEAALKVYDINDINLIEGGHKFPIPQGKKILDNLHLTLFFAKVGKNWLYNEQNHLKDSTFLDKDELKGIASHSPSLLSDLLYWAITSDALFEQNTS